MKKLRPSEPSVAIVAPSSKWRSTNSPARRVAVFSSRSENSGTARMRSTDGWAMCVTLQIRTRPCHLCSPTAPRFDPRPRRGAPRSGGGAPRRAATGGSPRRRRHRLARACRRSPRARVSSVSKVSSSPLMAAPPPPLPSGSRARARCRGALRESDCAASRRAVAAGAHDRVATRECRAGRERLEPGGGVIE